MKWFRWACLLVFVLFFCIILFSNDNDWDHFLAFLEVERRSWLLDFRPPLWTYQLCAGVTRLGDPQSFGLSPLILPVLVFGTFWGSKIMVMSCQIIGFVYLAKLLELIDPAPEKEKVVHQSLSLFFIFGSYFWWHLYVGHLTFALMSLVFVPVYYFIQGCLYGLRRSEVIVFLLGAYTYCSAGVYHSVVFLVIPVLCLVGLGSVVYILRQGFFNQFLSWGRTKRVGISLLIVFGALVLSSYKWIGVVHYQHLYPRDFTQRFREATSFIHLLVYLFVPIWNYRFAGIDPGWGPWAIYEYGAFSAIPWILLGALFAGFVTKKNEKGVSRKNSFGFELSVCFILAIFLCLGDSSPVNLHGILNSVLYKGSVRVVGRYAIVLVLGMVVFLVRYLGVNSEVRRVYLKYLVPAGVVLTLMNAITFVPLMDLGRFWVLVDGSSVPTEEMRTLAWVPPRVIQTFPGASYMYGAVDEGEIVMNCYQPLSMPRVISNEDVRSDVLPPLQNGKMDLLGPGKTPLSDACRSSAYVTQNEIHYDRSSCPDDLCFHVNALNLYRTEPLVWNPQRKLFCVK